MRPAEQGQPQIRVGVGEGGHLAGRLLGDHEEQDRADPQGDVGAQVGALAGRDLGGAEHEDEVAQGGTCRDDEHGCGDGVEQAAGQDVEDRDECGRGHHGQERGEYDMYPESWTH